MLCNALTSTCVRRLAKTFNDHFRQEFLTVMEAARSHMKPNNELDDIFDDDSDDGDDTQRRRKSQTAILLRRTVTLTIGGFDVECLNSRVRLALLLDDKTIKFIHGWIVPLLKKLAPSQEATSSTSDSSDSSAKTPSFSDLLFTANQTPNAREKVSWHPCYHSWNANMKGDQQKLQYAWDEYKKIKDDEKETVKVPHR